MKRRLSCAIVLALWSPWAVAVSSQDKLSIELDAATEERCVTVLREGLSNVDFWPSIHAAEGLTLGGRGAEVRRYLAPKLGAESDDQHRCGIARELVRAGDRFYVDTMLEILAGESTYGQTHAAESLYKVVELGDGMALRKAFQQNQNQRLKLMAAGALGRCGNPTAMKFLRESLQTDDMEMLQVAAWILGRIGNASDIPLLKQQLPRCTDELLIAYIHHSLAALGDAEGLQKLLENLTSRNADVRTYAATFAGDARAIQAVDTLKQMLDDSHLDAAYRAAQSLLVLSRPPPLNSQQDVTSIVFPATEDNPRYTEGSIVPLRDGSLLFAVTEFQHDNSDFAKAQIVGRTSSDAGRNWSDARVLQPNTGNMNVMSVTLRRLQNRALAMFYLQKNSTTDLRLLLRLSRDEGVSFGPPTLVSIDAGYHVVNNDRIVQLSSGRLLAPAASTGDVEKQNHFVSHCYLSDDNGDSWRNSRGQVDASQRGAMEPEVIELSDGRIMMILRTQLGYIGKSYSSDGGDSWSKMSSLGLRAPEAPATLRRIPSTGDLLLLWNNTFAAGNDHGGKRTPLTAAISHDEGESWTVVGDLESNPERTFSYTSLTFVGERAVMSYWETGDQPGQYACRFRSIPVSWFYKAEESR